MFWSYVPIVLLFSAAFVLVCLALFVVRRHSTPASWPFAVLLLAAAEWAFSGGFELLASDGSARLLWVNWGYVGIVLVPLAWFVFVLEYTGHAKWLTWQRRAFLSLHPLLVLASVWSGSGHLWLRMFTLKAGGGFQPGPLFYIHSMYIYALFGWGLILFVRKIRNTPRLYHQPAAMLLLAFLLPCLAGLCVLNLTPLAFALSALVMAGNGMSFLFFSILPVAQDAVIDAMSEGMLVLDAHDHFVDVNPAALRILNLPRAEVVGLPLEKVFGLPDDLPEWRDNAQKLQMEIVLEQAGAEHYYDLCISPLYHRRGGLNGRLVVLHDISRSKHVEKTLRRHEHFLESLNDITRAALETADLKMMLKTLTARLADLFTADSCYLSLWDELAQLFIPGTAYIPGQGDAAHDFVLFDELCLPESVLDSHKPLAIADVLSSSYFDSRSAAALTSRSLLFLPLVLGEQKLGVVVLGFEKLHHFTADEVTYGEQAARQIFLVIAKSRVLEDERLAREHAAALYEVASTLLSFEDLADLLHSIVCSIAAALPAERVLLALLDIQAQQITYAALGSAQESGLCLPQVSFTGIWEGQLGKALHERQSALFSKAAFGDWDALDVQMLCDEIVVSSVVASPLCCHGRILGMMVALNSETTEDFDLQDQALLSVMSNQVAMAIENARLYEETCKRATELGTLYEVTTAGMAVMRLDEILQRVMAALKTSLHSDGIAILLVDAFSGELVLEAVTGFEEGAILERRAIGVGIPGWVVQTGLPVLTSDVRKDERYHEGDACTLSELCVPLRIGQHVIGAINLENRCLDAFTEEDLRLLSILAGHLAAVIENARLFEDMERLKVFNESIVLGVAETILLEDEQGTFTFANPAAYELLGYPQGALIGLTWGAIVPAVALERGETPSLCLNRLQDETVQYETVLRTREGGLIPVLVGSRSLVKDGQFVGILSALTDITERKRAEEERVQLIGELDAFAHTVAHDLKNPLTVILSAAKVLESRGHVTSNQELQHWIKIISRGGQKIHAIIEELLLLAGVRRMETLETRPLSMNQIVDEALTRLSLMVEKSDAEIILPEFWPTALGYGPWVEEVWANYISNAIKYGGTPPRIEVGATYQSEGVDSKVVRFWVRDNGAGLTLEEQARVFGSFTRLEHVNVEGHGLGLSIVKRIVERLDGQVGVESSVNGGCVFSFTLPALDDDGLKPFQI